MKSSSQKAEQGKKAPVALILLGLGIAAGATALAFRSKTPRDEHYGPATT